MTTVQCEPWAAMIEEAREIFPLHWKELAVSQDKIKMAVDEEKYSALDQRGMLHIVTVRSDARLVGYAIAFVMPHMHYKDAGDMAYTDMYFVLPDYRNGSGVKLFMELERSLRERGVVNVFTSCKVQQDHSLLFERLGWVWQDKTFSKYIGR